MNLKITVNQGQKPGKDHSLIVITRNKFCQSLICLLFSNLLWQHQWTEISSTKPSWVTSSFRKRKHVVINLACLKVFFFKAYTSHPVGPRSMVFSDISELFCAWVSQTGHSDGPRETTVAGGRNWFCHHLFSGHLRFTDLSWLQCKERTSLHDF